MSADPFVHLHLHTCYSLLDGACRVENIMDAAEKYDMPAVAITDHGVMYGVIDFYEAATKRGIKPIIGCETYVAPGSRFDRKSDGPKQPNQHLVLLATDIRGYHNLVKLVSLAHTEGFYYKARIDLEILDKYREGLIGLSACLKGDVALRLAEDDVKGATAAAMRYAEILGKDNFYLEIQDHGIKKQRKVNELMSKVSAETELPMVASNDVHYIEKSHAKAHEILLCLQTQAFLSDPKHMKYETEEFYMKSPAEMKKLFKDFPGAVERTVEIADRCNVELEFGKLHFPTFGVPKKFTQKSYLEELALEGVKEHYGISDPHNPSSDGEKVVMERFEREMGIIEDKGFINYFLVVWDFVRFAHDNDIPVGPGRGSGGGSLVAYALGITAIDPLEFGLLFERFLNPERVSPPDFDIDFCQARRGEVIEYVKNKYGSENVAQIITFGSLGAKLVIRDIGRVLEIPYAECDRLAKMVPDDPKMTLKRALELNPEFKKQYETNENCRRILDYGFVIEGLYRNPGTHAAGVVIGDKPLIEIVPLALDKDDQPVTQYTMEPLSKIGLLKMDFLGLKTLTVIRETVDIIKETIGDTVDIDNLPMNDEPTYALFNRGDTIGVFQLESSGMRDLIRRIGIDRIEDLIAMIALYRPGPMNMLDDYVKRKSGKAKIKYDHELLAPILGETYGIMLYQEQVQQAANVLAGFSLGDADVLRRAMGKKKASVMEAQREKFIEGCVKTNDMKPAAAGKIFDTIAKFAGYGFNKAHSTGYAIIAYQTAYLKANYPAEFMSALLSGEMTNFDKLPVFMNEAEQMGIKILPPDINSSETRFRPADGGIRFGLAGIKNVGAGAAAAIVEEREANGPYSGLVDFCSRIDGRNVNKKVIEALARAGTFDSVEPNRARVFNGLDFALARAADAAADKRSGQTSLFDMLDGGKDEAMNAELPECKPWPEADMLAAERELLGVYISGHPLSQYAPLMEQYCLSTIDKLGDLEDRALTRLAGIVSGVNRTVTKSSKEPMAIVEMEDLEGSATVLVFPEAYRTYGSNIEPDAPVIVCGEVSNNEDKPKLIAHELYPLREAPSLFTTRVSLRIPAAHADEDRLQRVRDIVRRHPGKVPVNICIEFPSGEKVFLEADDKLNVLPGRDLVLELEKELGTDGVYVAVNPRPCRNGKPAGNGRRYARTGGRN